MSFVNRFRFNMCCILHKVNILKIKFSFLHIKLDRSARQRYYRWIVANLQRDSQRYIHNNLILSMDGSLCWPREYIDCTLIWRFVSVLQTNHTLCTDSFLKIHNQWVVAIANIHIIMWSLDHIISIDDITVVVLCNLLANSIGPIQSWHCRRSALSISPMIY